MSPDTPDKKKDETEKVPREAFRKRSKRRKPGDAHTIPSFCESNAISISTYYGLKRQNRGPREIEIGGRIIISPEAEADWRREQEAETAERRRRKRERERAAAAAEPTTSSTTAT